jgi:2,5-furandicarboxylate decarboxylase 1
MVKCETIDVEVPAFAEIMLECEIHPDEREPAAPFGEYLGTYGPERINPVVYVKAITMRKTPTSQLVCETRRQPAALQRYAKQLNLQHVQDRE